MSAGRPTKYKKEFCEQARKLCLKGFIDIELADFFNVNPDTIHEWKKKYPDFSESIKDGKKYSNDKVKEALYNRALGYEVEEVKIEIEDGREVKKTVTTKQQAADVAACNIWLKNRDKENWKDKPESDEDDKGEELTINFNVSEPVSDVKITRGKPKSE